MKIKLLLPNRMIPDYRYHDIISFGFELSLKYLYIDYPLLKYNKRNKSIKIYLICG